MKVKSGIWLSVVGLALSAYAYEGPVQTVSVWRGETTYIEVEDKLAGELRAVGVAAREGVKVEPYAIVTTPYTTTPQDATLTRRYDRWERVEQTASAARTGCRVSVDLTTKAGNYTFGPLVVRVVDRVLPPPSEWRYYLDLWQHPWAVSRWAGVKPFSPEHYAAMKSVWQALAAAGQKTLTTTLLDLPWNHQCYDAYYSMIGRTKVKGDGQEWRFDYKIFDDYVEFGRSCGLGPDIHCYTMCPWEYVVRWQDESGRTCSAKAVPGSAAFEDYWGDFLVDFARHLKEKGWFDHTYIAMDERSPEDVRFIAEFIRARVPDFKIAMPANRKPSDFVGIELENSCVVLQHVTDDYVAEAKARREKGYVTTFYVCCNPTRPNTFMASADAEAFWLGVYPALSGLDGFLRWAANSWPADPYEDAAFGNWTAGDTFLIYPHGELSSRFVYLRAGIVTAEKLRILREQGLDEQKVADLAAKYPREKALQGAIDFSACRRDLEWLVNL